MKKIYSSLLFCLLLSLGLNAQTVTFKAKHTEAGVIKIYGIYDGATPYTFISGISSFSMTFEYARAQANGGVAFANAAAVTAWNTTFRNTVVYNPAYFTGSSSAGTMGDGGGTPGTTFTALNASTNLSTNVASSGLQSIPGTDFPINTEVLFATITLPANLTVSGLTLKDWANNRAYGSGAPLYAWSLNFDGTTVENVATIFTQSTTTNAPNNSGSAAQTSAMNFTGTPLPLKLLAFNVMKAGESRAQINWHTAQEAGTDYFEVERSLDGRNFNTSVGRVTAAGTSDKQLDYQTYDNSPATGLNYYRMKLVDVSGSRSYSEIRSLSFDGGVRSFTLTPNPASDFIVVKGMDANASIVILSMTGQVISTIKPIGNSETIRLNMAPGTYAIQIIQDGTIVHNTKFTKQ